MGGARLGRRELALAQLVGLRWCGRAVQVESAGPGSAFCAVQPGGYWAVQRRPQVIQRSHGRM